MDPALQELLAGFPNEEVEVIIRLQNPQAVPEQVRLVAQFGSIATCRLYRRAIPKVWGSEEVISVKAARTLTLEPDPMLAEADEPFRESISMEQTYRRRGDYPETGKGVVVGLADWGFDFTHPNFRNPDGTTRFRAIWDQSAIGEPGITYYGYRRIYTRDDINRALATNSPFETLGYHSGASDPSGVGAHGTHVLDIAAGNGRIGQSGVAPDAILAAVQLSSDRSAGDALTTLGDSVRVLEAVHFLHEVAGEDALVINLSVGKHGGPHTGQTLVEQALDYLVEHHPGRFIVQSTGNYFRAGAHASCQLARGGSQKLAWYVAPEDRTPNELEVWYSGQDRFEAEIIGPDETLRVAVPLGGKVDLAYNGTLVGRAHHRANEPNTGSHHINLFLYVAAPRGIWHLALQGAAVQDGRFHAWIERDAACRGCQSYFVPAQVNPAYTTGTIAMVDIN